MPQSLVTALAACLLAACVSDGRPARVSAKPAPARTQSASLPPPFSRFSAGEVLGQVFDRYDAATGRVAGILNDGEKPAPVRVLEAKPWHANNEARLVVLAEIAADEQQFSEPGGLCGGCAAYAVLAVLRRDGERLILVARQDLPARSVPVSAPSDADERDPFAPLFYTGHHTGVSLDLAPYRLSAGETLVGVRLTELWAPAFTHSTELQLLRVEGRRLRRVFGELVVEREWETPARGEKLTLEETTSTLSLRPTRGPFNELVVSKTTLRCTDFNGDYGCGPGPELARMKGRRTEVWRFDGRRFYETSEKGDSRR